jgi:hypothetical protein
MAHIQFIEFTISLEAGQLLRVRGRGVRERGREKGEVNGKRERVKKMVGVTVVV